MTNSNLQIATDNAGTEARGPRQSPEAESHDWTIVSRPGAAVEISTRSMPAHIREAIARSLGIGTGQPNEA